MKNKTYFPFERNHYFYGKLLTVRDFEMEQRYGNNKRRILNKMIHGSGVIAGLDVVLVDDQSISVEAGMALDGFGREIILQEPIIKRLKLIDGFNQVKDSAPIYLCMEYDEDYTEPVHSVVSSPGEEVDDRQYNRITESYRLFLTDEPLPADSLMKYRLEKEKIVLFQNHLLTVEQVVPRFVEEGKALEIEVYITKRGTIDPVEVRYLAQSAHLKDEQGQNSIEVFFQEKINKKEWQIQKKYLFYAEQVKKTIDQIYIAKENFAITIGQETFTIDADIRQTVQVIDEPVRNRLLQEYYRQDFSDIHSGAGSSALYLAKLNLITSGDLYIIESLEKMPFQQYIFNNELLQLMLESAVKEKQQEKELPVEAPTEEINVVESAGPTYEEQLHQCFAAGTEEIDIRIDRNKDKRFFSHEIAHGLGSGPVAIVLALEETKKNAEEYGEEILVFGDNSIFNNIQYKTKLPEHRLGAQAYSDRGTFRIGLHLMEQANTPSLKVRWWAYKHPGIEQKEDSLWALKHIRIAIVPDTITVAPREKVHFVSAIEGTNNKECRWQVKEENGGTIDYNGLYEAPSTEGVFEVIAQSVKYPQKKTSAFVVVKA
ncbi:hypothetical protein F9B85_10325 [Heliorestis acidaminivorans]|uniref:Uncharacterized protein n=1 Tax=Heliorestis acidaminivorans TaxID=553427 RepID=A0A6I0EZ76_9FIRM|nr:hypothetical protein [Heliorestis acidaminivorans]KAB2951945.1 hypothetical protein F9B85_10325 [Heliorestis acidaminivorans]